MSENLEPNGSENNTRPNNASRQAKKRGGDIQRYTVDLSREQRRALSMWSAEWEVDKSKIVRTLIYLLEADKEIRNRVQSELFYEEESDSDE
jgi:hypothetical protein